MGAAKMLSTIHYPIAEEESGGTAIIEREVENILENGVYRYLRNSDGTRKDKTAGSASAFPSSTSPMLLRSSTPSHA